MKHQKIITTLLIMFATAQAQQVQTIQTENKDPLEVRLHECFRQNEFFVICDFSIRNTSKKDLQVYANLKNFQSRVAQEKLPSVALNMAGFGFDENTYSNPNLFLPRNLSLYLQVKFQPPKTAQKLDEVQIYGATFKQVPLTEEPWDLPTLNPATDNALTTFKAEGYQQDLVSCYRLQQNQVECLFSLQNTSRSPLTFNTNLGKIYGLGQDGLFYRPNGVSLGEQARVGNDYESTSLPTDTKIANYLTFSLPENLNFLAYLQLDGALYRNITILPKEATVTLELPRGESIQETRNDQLRAKIQTCQRNPNNREEVLCNMLVKSVDRQTHRLGYMTGAYWLTPQGLWGEAFFPNDEVNVPMDGTAQATLVIKAAENTSFIPYLSFSGLVFRNLRIEP